MERDYHGALSVAAGRVVTPPCCNTLHISLFFDGTGNNLFDDLYRSQIPHPTNIARLFRATVGTGYAGGAASAEGLTDPPGTGMGQYFKYYMPGVGTPFPEVGDLDYSDMGLAFAYYGEERINWGLLMIIDALRQYLDMPRMGDASLYASVKAMGAVMNAGGRGRRQTEFSKQFRALEAPLRIALVQPSQGRPKLVGVKLYVYGFSRGAAAARAFVNWLNELLGHEVPAQPALVLGKLRLPVEVQYLGLLDTVASVGIAAIAPGARGQMGWADESQQLPGGNALVKRCLHLVSAHEQRLCFPLDSIRRETGGYPVNSQEVIYPGVHSDIGGGYPPGDQGKAKGNDGLLMSQIVLHDLYADAFFHGAPLKVSIDTLPDELSHETWRAMRFEVADEFRVTSMLIARFNAWCKLTQEVSYNAPKLASSKNEIDLYQPLPATDTLEKASRTQLGWLTAWRIDRYAFASLKNTAFYRHATDTHRDPPQLARARAERAAAQVKVTERRKAYQRSVKNGNAEQKALEPGIKPIDPDLAQTQLREAAQEFAGAFRDPNHLRLAVHRLIPARAPSLIVYEVIHVDAGAECLQLKAAGRARLGQLFPPPAGYYNHLDDNHRGQVDESLNAHKPEGMLRALFDDHVHDSRAWFVYALGREPMGSFFRERMVFFGNASRRELALNDQQDNTLLAAHIVPAPAPEMTPERLAQVQREGEERHRAYQASLERVRHEAT
ncbi:hypothetical protein GCM10017655_23400 [Pseudomonas turukhanskensis]|uniref:DUF2235 domain-containing protein n=2 Tax=Pseudomonas turukhanskensis TaxID=1806536 RepID=A0A9W6NFR1_9PSED|nr:hypothetical protein GCM10017655_23400 [Pseudomonas turukhanskensis]